MLYYMFRLQNQRQIFTKLKYKRKLIVKAYIE